MSELENFLIWKIPSYKWKLNMANVAKRDDLVETGEKYLTKKKRKNIVNYIEQNKNANFI